MEQMPNICCFSLFYKNLNLVLDSWWDSQQFQIGCTPEHRQFIACSFTFHHSTWTHALFLHLQWVHLLVFTLWKEFSCQWMKVPFCAHSFAVHSFWRVLWRNVVRVAWSALEMLVVTVKAWATHIHVPYLRQCLSRHKIPFNFMK